MIMSKEQSVNLLPYEMNILMAGLNSLSLRDETRLNKEYGSVSALYNKIYSAWERSGDKDIKVPSQFEPSY
jgi:hypothetical protein